MRINIKRNSKDFPSDISKKNVFFIYIYFLVISILLFNSGCGGSRQYYQKETSPKNYHVVKKGDTIYSIGRKYNISPKSIILYNRLANPKDIEIGEKIYLPPGKNINTVYKSKKVKPSNKGKITAIDFIWPVKGPLTSKFGFRLGIPHKGIDLAVPAGTKVLAAYDGEVALVESRPRGLGDVVILRHKNDFITVYGHNSKILVKEEQIVKKGQPISLSGSTGWSTGPHLHFEIRCKGDALDPLEYLP